MAEELAPDLAAAIRELRGRRTQAEVSRRARINPAIWSLYETGRRTPRRGTLERVLRGLGCTRLELEETAWRFRRRRLLGEDGAAREAGDPRYVEAAHTTADRLLDQDGGDPLRRELRRLLGHRAVLDEELILLLIRVLAREREAGAVAGDAAAGNGDRGLAGEVAAVAAGIVETRPGKARGTNHRGRR